MIIYKFLILGSTQVSVSYLLALSDFPLKIIDISVAYINRLGLYYLVFTGTYLQHFFFQDAHHSNNFLSSVPNNQHWATGFSVPKCYDHFIALRLMIFQPLIKHLMLLMQSSKFWYTMDWGTCSPGDEDAT